MTVIATNSGYPIVKDGFLASNCNCCGGCNECCSATPPDEVSVGLTMAASDVCYFCRDQDGSVHNTFAQVNADIGLSGTFTLARTTPPSDNDANIYCISYSYLSCTSASLLSIEATLYRTRAGAFPTACQWLVSGSYRQYRATAAPDCYTPPFVSCSQLLGYTSTGFGFGVVFVNGVDSLTETSGSVLTKTGPCSYTGTGTNPLTIIRTCDGLAVSRPQLAVSLYV